MIAAVPSAAAVLALVGLLSGAYLKGRTDGEEIEAATQLREAAAESRMTAAAQRAIAQAVAKIEIKHTTIRQTLEREIHEKPVYRDCRHSADGLRAVNAALGNGDGGSAPAGGGELPAAGTAE